MAHRSIVKLGDDILRKKAKPVKVFDENLWELLDDMGETMFKANGVGLAAPQIGVLKRIVVMEVNNMYIEMINPVITETFGEQIDEEGCLSVGKVREYVKRPERVTVKAQDRFGNEFTLTGEKLLARCICHETDHLEGVLFIDKAIKDYVPKGDK